MALSEHDRNELLRLVTGLNGDIRHIESMAATLRERIADMVAKLEEESIEGNG